MEVIDSVVFQYADMSADQLSDLTHEKDSIWSRVVAENGLTFEDSKKSDIPVPLTMLNEGDIDKQETYEDARWNMGFQAALNQHKN